MQHHRRRLDAYVRVSKIGNRDRDDPSFITADVQEERIRAWATANGHDIVEVFAELDVSGGTMDRPMLNAVMARIESGESDGVVVYNLSRFARTSIGAMELIQRINAREALFASVQDGFDITTVTGRMVFGILLSVSVGERERIQENWGIARTRAVVRGIHVASITPFGYVRGEGPVNERTGKPAPAPLEVDPVTGPVVAELFARRAAGETWTALRAWLEEAGVPTVRGAAWSTPAVRAVIANRAYLGIAGGAGKGDLPNGRPDSHPALVDRATWQAAQTRRTLRADHSPSPSVLRGLLRCGGCRYTLQASVLKRDGALNYHCPSGGVRAGCKAPATIAAITADGASGLDDAVVAAMWEHLERVAFEGLDATIDLDADERERDELVARRDADQDDGELRGAVGRAAWLDGLARLTARIEEVQARIDDKLARLGRPDGTPVAELRAMWESGEMTMEDKRDHLAAVVQAVFVKRGRASFGGRAVSPELRRARYLERVDIVWTTDPPLTDVPRQGRAGYVIRPWPFTNANPHVAGAAAL